MGTTECPVGTVQTDRAPGAQRRNALNLKLTRKCSPPEAFLRYGMDTKWTGIILPSSVYNFEYILFKNWNYN
ncbi:UNVERIFIED_CONTAM: hypothetical protein PYX00_004306 [Menopon gallinae]|uniref:Uncharacterized protein n=1 Tax=Menopon gallinae TaxID=328185 RepID=A0AAW2I512_9NEOP